MSSSSVSSDEKKAAETYKEEGNGLFKNGKYVQALEKYRQACALNPAIATYFNNAALCCEKLEDYQAMQRASEKAVEIDDKCSKGYYRLAVASMKLEQFSRAQDAINKGTAVGEHLTDFEQLPLQLEESIDLVKCWNCGKDDADMVCSKCLAATYCNRDCQAAHWKSSHKNVCQALNRPAISICQNCRKQLTSPRVCNKCNMAYYCSRKCLLEHRPQHRSACKLNQECQQRVSERGHMNQYKVLEKWSSRALRFVSMIGTHAMTKKQFLQQPSSFAIRVMVRFDFNYCTFIPISQILIPDESLPSDVRGLVRRDRQQHRGAHHLLHVFLIKDENGLNPVATVTIAIPPNDFQSRSVDDINHLIRSTFNLNPPLQQTWVPQAMKNMKDQVHAIKEKAGDMFSDFLLNALRVYCTNPRYRTHAIIVHTKLGFDLGEIVEVQSYKVVSLAEARQLVQADREALNRLDVENSPRLLKSRIQFPRNVLLATIWKVSDVDNMILVDSNLYQLEDGKELQTPKKCNKVANDCFQAVQTVEVPKVESPPLSSVSLGI